MTPIESLVLTQCGAMFVASLFLIFHPRYNDGVLGRFGLILIGLATFAAVIQALFDDLDWAPPPITVVLLTGFTLFLLRHTWRAYRFCGAPRIKEGAVNGNA